MTEETARKWLKQALHDLRMADRNIDVEGYDIAAFLAHQAVEKLLRALCALEMKKVPKSHYIDELAHALDVPDDVMAPILYLTADYTLTRYPDVSDKVPYEQYDEEIAREKVDAARKVFEALKDRYKPILEDTDDA